MTGSGRQVVLGLGNVLKRDEGLGVHALEPLRDRLGEGTGIEVLDGGVLGMGLLPVIESCGRLLVLDAVDAGAPPGTLVELPREEIPLFTRLKLSWHQIGFQEVLQMARARGRLPARLHLVGAQPSDLSIGIGLSPEVAAVLPAVVGRAVEILDAWRSD